MENIGMETQEDLFELKTEIMKLKEHIRKNEEDLSFFLYLLEKNHDKIY